MPGMDGFQAVQSIKNNPRTSAIPILMYTSQEGDLYLGQARALGAEGVLPKQIKHSDVTKMLYQLRLVNDRRGGEQTTFTRLAPAGAPANEAAMNSAIVLPAPVANRSRRRPPRPRRPRSDNSRPAAAGCPSKSAPRSTSPCRRKSPRCAASSARRSNRMPNDCRPTWRCSRPRRPLPASTCQP